MYCSRTLCAIKKRQIASKIRQFSTETVVLFEDETDLLLYPPLRAGWAKRGSPLEVPLTGRNAKRVVFGAMNPRTGHRLLMSRIRGRSEDFQIFLNLIRHHYRDLPLAILLDENSSHTAMATVRTAQRLGIQFLWLPIRCPELNAMEGLWGDGKDHICANHQYATIEDEESQFIGYLSSLTPHATLQKGGVLSDDFWLPL